MMRNVILSISIFVVISLITMYLIVDKRKEAIDQLKLVGAGIDFKENRYSSCLGEASMIGFGNPAKITDKELLYVKDLDALTMIDLVGTKITNEGLKCLKDLDNLSELNLGATNISDDGIFFLENLKNLTLFTRHSTHAAAFSVIICCFSGKIKGGLYSS